VTLLQFVPLPLLQERDLTRDQAQEVASQVTLLQFVPLPLLQERDLTHDRAQEDSLSGDAPTIILLALL